MKSKRLVLVLLMVLSLSFMIASKMNQPILAALGDSNVIKIRSEDQVENLIGGVELHQQKISALKDGQGNYYYDYSSQWLVTQPNGEGTKLVSWSYREANKWKMAGVTEIAKDFEKHNPGWIVVGGVNADFFYINTTGQMLNNACENGDMICSTNDNSNVWRRGIVGFDSNNNLITGIPELTSYYNMHVYSDSKQVDQKLVSQVDINPSTLNPNALTMITKDSPHSYDLTGYKVLVGQYDITRVSEDKQYFVKGLILSSRQGTKNERPLMTKNVTDENGNQKIEPINEFYVVSKNINELDKINVGDYVKGQKDYLNGYADVQNSVSYMWKIVDNGTVMFEGHTLSDKRAEIMNKYAGGWDDISYATCTKARCLFGIKEDGSYVMTVIDGTSSSGMTLSEAGVFIKEIGCVNAWDFDGGGSATLVAKINDKFKTINVPSDAGNGTERRVGNALLIVARDPGFAPSSSKSTVSSIVVEKKDMDGYEDITNIKISLGDKEYQIADQTSIEFESLVEDTEYRIDISFEADGKKYLTSYTAKTKKYDPGIDINPTSKGFEIGLRQSDENLITSKIVLNVDGKDYIINNKDGLLTDYIINDLYKGEVYKISYTYEVTIIETGETYAREVETKEYSTLNYDIPSITEFEVKKKRGKIVVSFDYEDVDKLAVSMYLLDNGNQINLSLSDNSYSLEDDNSNHDFQLVISFTTPHGATRQTKSKMISTTHEHEWMDATCKAPKTCKTCNETEGDPLGHTESDWIIDSNPTCTTEGKKHKECTVCYEKLEEEVIEKLAHEWIDATCNTPKTCTVCKGTEGEPLGHVESEWIIDKDSTCKEEGKKHKECSRCGEKLQEETIEKKEHTWKDATTEAPKTCSVCGTTEGEKLPETQTPKKKGCKKTSVALLLTSVTILCTSVYLFRKKR